MFYFNTFSFSDKYNIVLKELFCACEIDDRAVL